MSRPPKLRTERLLLRPFRLEDVDEVFEYARDPEWARYLPRVPQPYTRRAAEESVSRNVLESWETHPTWAIVLDQKVIGGIVLMVDVQNGIGELGYELSREHWGRELMIEAARAVIDWGFAPWRLAKIFAQADARNKRSLRVMEKLHMRREGVLRSHGETRGERVDDVHYGILREEWNGHDPLSPARLDSQDMHGAEIIKATGPVELSTQRLLLRRFRPSDVDDVLAVASDRELATFLPALPQPYTRRDADEFVGR